MHTGKIISKAIEAKKLEKIEVAERMNVHKQRVSILCSMPNCNVDTLEKVAKALDMPLWVMIKKYGDE
jgi:4-hydroxy-3-methylbut-2-en-1-yl diphosphate synthase IspG/GcpE